MSFPCLRRGATWSTWACLIGLAAGPLSADTVTLKAGGAVHGKVVTARDPNAVALESAKGALVVFNRADVKSVQRAASAAATKRAAANSAAKKPQLTPQEKAWMSKIHALVERANSTDANRRRKAISDLLNVNDEAAIPALTRSLANSSNPSDREFYARVLRNIPGQKAVYYLIQLSMVDASAAVREAARKAIGEERADIARPLYIEILKLRNPILSSLAAKGIGEIGDPNCDSVPYLIDAVVFNIPRLVVTSQAQVFDADRLAQINYDNQLMAQAQAAANAPPAVAPPKSQIRVGKNLAADAPMPMGDNIRSTMGGSPLGYANITLPPTMGPIIPPMYGARNPQIREITITTTTHVTLGDILNTPVRYSTGVVAEKNVNPAVYDTLIQLTGQKFGDNVANWRRFWANQLKNRALKSVKKQDHPISKPASP